MFLGFLYVSLFPFLFFLSFFSFVRSLVLQPLPFCFSSLPVADPNLPWKLTHSFLFFSLSSFTRRQPIRFFQCITIRFAQPLTHRSSMLGQSGSKTAPWSATAGILGSWVGLRVSDIYIYIYIYIFLLVFLVLLHMGFFRQSEAGWSWDWDERVIWLGLGLVFRILLRTKTM